MNRIPVIILAAGESSRLGSPKQLLTYGGKTLLAHAIHTAREAQFSPVVVVLGAFRDQIKPTIKSLDVGIVVNHRWKEGMGGSLQAGINYLMEHYPASPACLTMLCDQPLLTFQHLENLREKWRQGKSPIVATRYGEIVGVPIVWDAQYFPRLLQVKGRVGARKLLAQYDSEVAAITFEPAARDIDTREDYSDLLG